MPNAEARQRCGGRARRPAAARARPPRPRRAARGRRRSRRPPDVRVTRGDAISLVLERPVLVGQNQPVRGGSRRGTPSGCDPLLGTTCEGGPAGGGSGWFQRFGTTLAAGLSDQPKDFLAVPAHSVLYIVRARLRMLAQVGVDLALGLSLDRGEPQRARGLVEVEAIAKLVRSFGLPMLGLQGADVLVGRDRDLRFPVALKVGRAAPVVAVMPFVVDEENRGPRLVAQVAHEVEHGTDLSLNVLVDVGALEAHEGVAEDRPRFEDAAGSEQAGLPALVVQAHAPVGREVEISESVGLECVAAPESIEPAVQRSSPDSSRTTMTGPGCATS